MKRKQVGLCSVEVGKSKPGKLVVSFSLHINTDNSPIALTGYSHFIVRDGILGVCLCVNVCLYWNCTMDRVTITIVSAV